jgi:hypothetical protein
MSLNSLYYGPKAIPEYAQAFDCSFTNPPGQYRKIIDVIERRAQDLGVDLRKRKCEPRFLAGKAARSKVDRVRHRYKAMCRLASQGTPTKSSTSLRASSMPKMSRLGGFSMDFDQRGDEPEVVVDVESPSAIATVEELSAPGRPAYPKTLAFRVWDNDRFVSSRHGRMMLTCSPQSNRIFTISRLSFFGRQQMEWYIFTASRSACERRE